MTLDLLKRKPQAPSGMACARSPQRQTSPTKTAWAFLVLTREVVCLPLREGVLTLKAPPLRPGPRPLSAWDASPAAQHPRLLETVWLSAGAAPHV